MKSEKGSYSSGPGPLALRKDGAVGRDLGSESPKPATIIGREKEIAVVCEHIGRRKGLHLYGPAGAGKSALLRHILSQWETIPSPPVPIYCGNAGTLREIILCIAHVLLERFGHLKGFDKYREPVRIRTARDVNAENIINLRNIVFRYLEKDDFCLILDHLEHVTPQINAFLSALHERTCVITASRQSWDLMDYGFTGRLAYDLWLVPKLRVENLHKDDAFLFMNSLYDSLNMNVSDKLGLFKDIYEISLGNPKMIRNVFAKAADLKYLHDGKPNLNLIVIDCRIEAVSMPEKE